MSDTELFRMNVYRAVVPFRIENPKSRLSSVLSPEERTMLARLLLKNAVGCLENAGIRKIDILSKTPLSLPEMMISSPPETSLSLLIDDRDLNTAVNAYLEKQTDPVLILMTDLPLVTGDILRRICDTASDICIAPGRGGGTNILKIDRPDIFRVRYHGQSFLNHKKQASENGLSFEVFDSFFAGADLDEPDDIAEILIHGNGPVRDFLSDIFRTDDSNGCLRAQVSARKRCAKNDAQKVTQKTADKKRHTKNSRQKTTHKKQDTKTVCKCTKTVYEKQYGKNSTGKTVTASYAQSRQKNRNRSGQKETGNSGSVRKNKKPGSAASS